jgi:hypothetical protein
VPSWPGSNRRIGRHWKQTRNNVYRKVAEFAENIEYFLCAFGAFAV